MKFQQWRENIKDNQRPPLTWNAHMKGRSGFSAQILKPQPNFLFLCFARKFGKRRKKGPKKMWRTLKRKNIGSSVALECITSSEKEILREGRWGSSLNSRVAKTLSMNEVINCRASAHAVRDMSLSIHGPKSGLQKKPYCIEFCSESSVWFFITKSPVWRKIFWWGKFSILLFGGLEQVKALFLFQINLL